MLNKKMKWVLVLVILILALIILNKNFSKESIYKSLKISKSFKGVYKFRTIETLKNEKKGEIKIKIVKIVLPENLKEAEIIKNLKASMAEVYNREKFYRIFVYAYTEGADINTTPPMATASFGQKDFDPMKDTLELKKYELKYKTIENK